MTAGGSAGGGVMDPVMAVIPNSRFIGIAQIAIGGPPFGAAVATVREPLDGGSSILEGWSSSGSAIPSLSRTTPWSTYRVTAIASNVSETAIAVRSQTDISVEAVVPSLNFTAAGTVGLAQASNSSISRLSMLPAGTTAPILAFVQDDSSGRAQFLRLSTSTLTTLSYAPAMGAVAVGDDLIDSPIPGSASSRLLVTVRCAGACSFAGSTVVTTSQEARFAWLNYSPVMNIVAAAASTHAALLSPNAMPVFSAAGPVRAASDGNTFVYFAGQSVGNELIIERRDAVTGLRDSLFPSTGTLRVVDLKRSPTGAAVLVLATYQSTSSFAGTFSFTFGNQRNIVVMRIDASGSVSAIPFDVPGDQQAVGFAGGGNGYLYIALNQGPDAVLWRIPDL